MPKTLDDVLSAVKGLPDGSDLATVIVGLKESEAASKSDAEAAKRERSTLHSTHSKLVETLKSLGYESGEPTVFVSSLKEKLEKGAQAGSQLTGTAAELDALKKSQNEIITKLSKAEERAQKVARTALRESLSGKLKDKLYGAEAYADHIINEGLAVLGEDGKTPVWKDGVDLEKGLSEFISARPHDQKNNQNPGVGGGGQGGNPGGKTMVRGEFSKMSPAAQASFVKDGGKLTD